MIPIVLLEKIMNLQLYNEVNKSGDINVGFEILGVIFHILKNESFVILFYSISLGYIFNVQ